MLPEKSPSSTLRLSLVEKIKARRNYYEDPPDFRWFLYGSLLIVMVGSGILMVTGYRLLLEPEILLQSYLESKSGNQSSARVSVCQDDVQDLCPIWPGLDSRLFLPQIWFESIFTFLACIGLIDIIICIMVQIFACKEKTKCLFAVLFLIPFVIAAKWKMVDLVVFDMTPMHESAKDELVKKYREVYGMDVKHPDDYNADDINPYIATMNSIMVTFGCCGIRGPEDFTYRRQMITYDDVDKDNLPVVLELPPACCVRPNFGNFTPGFLDNIMDVQCMSQRISWAANDLGCFPAVFNYIYKAYGRNVLIVLLIVIHIQSLQTVFTIFVLLKRNRVKTKSTRSLIASRGASAQLEVSPMNPPQKQQSHGDIIRREDRRRSTTIL